MASIPAPAVLQNAHANELVPASAGAFGVNQIPTSRDIVIETKRLKGIKLVHEMGGDNFVSEQEQAGAISRYFKVVSKFANQKVADPGTPAWANNILTSLDQMNTRMGKMETMIGQMHATNGQIEARMGQIEARMGQMEATIRQIDVKSEVGHARTHNVIITDHIRSFLFPIVKYIPGHPAVELRGQFPFDRQQYDIGMPPPNALVPDTLRGVRAINSSAKLDAIYWFYNDPRLAGGSVTDRRDALELFLKFF